MPKREIRASVHDTHDWHDDDGRLAIISVLRCARCGARVSLERNETLASAMRRLRVPFSCDEALVSRVMLD